MPSITLKYNDKVLPVTFKNIALEKYPVNLGQTVTIGRHASNDIVIDNMAVSGKHARIDTVATTFVLTDLDSTNGTFVNEQLISTHGLKNNDVILIGKHELIFDRSDLNQRSDGGYEDLQDEKTCLLDTAKYKSLISEAQDTAPDTVTESSEQRSSDKKKGLFSKLFKK